MVINKHIQILIADDTLLDEVAVNPNEVEALLSERLKNIRIDIGCPHADVIVKVINHIDDLEKALSATKWDFIALDNNWEEEGHGEFGFQIASNLRKQEGINHETPLCIFTRHDWLKKTENISRIYSLDDSTASVESFADFFPKPARSVEDIDGILWLERFSIELLVRMKACFLLRKLERKIEHLNSALVAQHGLVGCSQGFIEAVTLCQRLGPTDAGILLLGETGTGKGSIARYIHSIHPVRSTKRLIEVNCGAIPETLIESELFGHEKGAFTGAIESRKGRFSLAEGGTIFLDEIGEMTLACQLRLLHVLEDRGFVTVGGNRTITPDVRIIAATNRDLDKAISEGKFRSDLYYRLGHVVNIPRLRDRLDDIPLLAEHFLNVFREKYDSNVSRFASSSIDKLRQYSWPGNIRELEETIERAVILAQKTKITSSDITFKSVATVSHNSKDRTRQDGEPLEIYLRRIAVNEINTALKRNQMKLVQTARELGMAPSTLHDRIHKQYKGDIYYKKG